VVDAKTGKDITGQPHVRYVGRTKKNSKQSKRERALIRKNGAAVGTEPKESK
jgi:hypothetical protein